MTDPRVVAHVNVQYFARSETFMYWYLRAMRRFRPICVSWFPIVNRELFPFPAEDCYSVRAPRYSPRWLWEGLGSRLTGGRSRRLQMGATLRARGACLLHANYGPVGWWSLALRDALKVPLVTTFYGGDVAPQMATEAPDWPARRAELFAEGDLFLAEGAHMRASLIALGCPPGKVEIQRIAIPVDGIPFRPPRATLEGAARLVFAGRFVEKKGLIYSLEAVAELVRQGRRIELRVVGDGPLAPAVRQYVREHGLADHVRLLGFLDHDAYLRELRDGDLFVHPSVTAASGDTEGGAPTTILEAQAVGLPVVSTVHADIPNVVRPGESAVLVPERDAARLAAALGELLDHPERWPGMGKAGRAQVEVCHDVGREVEGLEEKYARVLARR